MARINNKYGFVKPSLVRLFTLIDGIGEILTRPFATSRPQVEPQRILLVNLAHIGDLLLTTPAIASVRQRYPQAYIAVLVAPWSREIVAHNPHLNEVISYRASWWDRSRGSPYWVLSEFVALVRLIRSYHFDCVINFKSFLQENLACWLAGIPCRIGYGLYGGGFLQTTLVPYDWDLHTVQQHMLLAAVLDVDTTHPFVEMFISDSEYEFAKQQVRQYERVIAFHVGAGAPAKLWSLQKYAQLATILSTSYQAAIVFVGSKDDLPLIQAVIETLAVPYRVFAGETTLLQSAAILKQSMLFIGNDSGPAHLAAAMQTPTIAIFSGVNQVDLWHPWGDHVTVLQYKPECYLCGLTICNRDHQCMKSITVEMVAEKAEELLRDGYTKPK